MAAQVISAQLELNSRTRARYASGNGPHVPAVPTQVDAPFTHRSASGHGSTTSPYACNSCNDWIWTRAENRLASRVQRVLRMCSLFTHARRLCKRDSFACQRRAISPAISGPTYVRIVLFRVRAGEDVILFPLPTLSKFT